jgi:E3 ubiquitin-protein ligase HERC4
VSEDVIRVVAKIAASTPYSSSVLLQYHGQLEMEEAIRNAMIQNFQRMLGASVETVNPVLILRVSRQNIVQDTINQVEICELNTRSFDRLFQLEKYKEADFKKPLKVFFQNEEGLDGGGLSKEFFLLLTKAILDPQYGMFSRIR